MAHIIMTYIKLWNYGTYNNDIGNIMANILITYVNLWHTWSQRLCLLDFYAAFKLCKHFKLRNLGGGST